MKALQAKSPNGKICTRTTKHNFTHVVFGKWEGRWCQYRWTREPHVAAAVEAAKRQGYADVTTVPVDPQPTDPL